jgi:hypothetical protein
MKSTTVCRTSRQTRGLGQHARPRPGAQQRSGWSRQGGNELRVLDVGLDFLRSGRSKVVREMHRSKRERGVAEKWLGCTSLY